MKSLFLFLSIAVNGYFFFVAPKVLGVYTSSEILYVDVQKNRITFEGRADTLNFNSFKELNEYVEDFTADASAPSGYANDIRWQANQGYLTAEIHPALTEDGKVTSPVGCVNVIYSGPNWSHGADSDTTFVLTSFNRVDSYNAEYDECLSCTYEMYVAYRID